MQYSFGYGDMRRTYTNTEIGMLQDLGYSVPEPSTLILMLAGSSVGIWRLRRSRRPMPDAGCRMPDDDDGGISVGCVKLAK
jgi:hypothetical protein